MAKDDPAPSAQPSGRETNTLEPEQKPQSKRRERTDASDALQGAVSRQPGDLPAELHKRYSAEPLAGGAIIAYYQGPGAKRPAFRDHGRRLSTEQDHPAIVRDLVVIAAHRGWSTLRVRGEDDFRREIWLEARSRDLEVLGYRPNARDLQELERREEARRRAERTSRPDAANQHDRDLKARAEPGLGAGLVGVFLEAGEAPYRRRPGAPSTPYLRLNENGAVVEVWGKGLPKAVAEANIQPGERIFIRQGRIDRLDRLQAPERQDGRGGAGHSRGVPLQSGVQDPARANAQSHLVVLETVIDGLIQDPQRRKRLQSEARRLVAEELDQGRRFPPARVCEIEPVLAHDLETVRRGERTRGR